MTITLISTTGLVAGVAHTYAAAGDDLFVVQGITWGSTNSGIVSTSLNNVSATFAGDVIAGGTGVTFNGVDTSLKILSTGSLTSYEPSYGNTVIFLGGQNGKVVNEGAITSAQSIGVLTSGNAQVTNSGTIDAASPVFIGLFSTANDSLINSGAITANGYDDANRDLRYNNGVLGEGSSNTIINLETGVISAVGTQAAGVRLNGAANGSLVENFGQIISLNFFGVSFSSMSTGNTATLANGGTISGAFGAFEGADGADTVINRGVMIGDVALGLGADLFDGRGGSVNGVVRGGGGNDTYIIDDANILLAEVVNEGIDLVKSSVGWTLGNNFETLDLMGTGNIRGIGNALANTITGNAGNNRLNGKGDKDTLSGGDGNDLIFGGDGRDILNGDDGDDILRGGGSKDKLYGGTGDDILRGGQAGDRLFGDTGNDILIGGLGTDTMTGGDGKDVFVFNRKADSLRGSPSDSITDFVIGEDRVDLSGLQPALSYIGSGAFSGTGGEVQVTLSGGNSIVKVDVDGDGTWDMKIVIDAVTGLSGADFIL